MAIKRGPDGVPLYARKKDANHDIIAYGFVFNGWKWYDTYKFGSGFGDGIAVLESGQTKLVVVVEIKTAKGRPTKAEKKFKREYPGYYEVVRTEDQVKMLTRYYRRLLAEVKR